jgi:predicted kinase
MNRLTANDLRNLVTEVVSAYWAEKQQQWLLESPEVIKEGVYDPGILKAVFTAGGPGSGKSYVADLAFDARVPGEDKKFDAASFVGRFGLKYVNSDPLFVKVLQKNGINPSDLATIAKTDPALWSQIQNPKNPQSYRNVAKGKLKQLQSFYEAGRLGLLIDGTGADYNKVARQKESLEALGYDTYMIFVDTSLENSFAQNAKRTRKLPKKLVKNKWTAVHQNKEKYVDLFGDNISLIDNNDQKPISRPVTREIQRFVEEPVENEAGKAWIQAQLKDKKRTD